MFMPSILISDLTEMLSFAESVARDAGHLVVEKWKKPLQLNDKGAHDIVTDADIASQELITERIIAKFPGHGFLPEEDDDRLPGPQDVTWVIDPIDGTVNFSRQNRVFCISIGVIVQDLPTLGVVYDPLSDELFSGAKGQGCFLNGVPLKSVSSVANLSEATIGFDWDSSDDLRLHALASIQNIINDVRMINIFGSAALALAWIAAGRMDGYFKFRLDAWDITAGAVLIEEAGGTISHHSGGNWNWLSQDKTFLASNKLLHKPLLEKLTKA